MPRRSITQKVQNNESPAAVLSVMPIVPPLQTRAIRRRAAATAPRRRGRKPAPDSMTVAQLLPLWEAEYRDLPNAHEEEIEWFVSIARERILPHLGDAPVAQVTEQEINQFCAAFAQTPELYIYTFFVVRSLFTFAYKKGLCTENPVPKVYCKKTYFFRRSSFQQNAAADESTAV